MKYIFVQHVKLKDLLKNFGGRLPLSLRFGYSLNCNPEIGITNNSYLLNSWGLKSGVDSGGGQRVSWPPVKNNAGGILTLSFQTLYR